MSALAKPQLSSFALDVAEGLGIVGQKKLPPRYFYDELGSALFEVITLLPEYGLTRADERILRRHAPDITAAIGPISLVVELGSGSGRKTRSILQAIASGTHRLTYRPVDLSTSALSACQKELGDAAAVEPVCADWLSGLAQVAASRRAQSPLLLLFLGSSIGNLDRTGITPFLRAVRSYLRPGDFFLLGADLVKEVAEMIAAYDDPLGVTAAFNLNLLNRMNLELGAHFDIHSFAHEARWDRAERRIEMHLVSRRNQEVYISALNRRFQFAAGETIWTESSHKFVESELYEYAFASGFGPVRTWIDLEWPFAETLWKAE